MNASTLVQKLWNCCNGPRLVRSLAGAPARERAGASVKPRLTLRDDGMSYGSRLMSDLERGALARRTPCRPPDDNDIVAALAEVHAGLILINPFREGNRPLARLLALLMALQARLPPLALGPLTGRARRAHVAGIHAALGGDYRPLAAMFRRVIERSRRRAASNAR
jgi:hypothetical protein